MSRRGGSPRSSAGSRRSTSPSRSYSNPVPAPRSPPPAAPKKAPPSGGTPKNRSLFKDMAATAAGVAVGSAVGHAVGAGVTGIFSGSGREQGVNAQERHHEQPCSFEIMQLLQCAHEQDDISFCQAASNAFKRCLKKKELVE